MARILREIAVAPPPAIALIRALYTLLWHLALPLVPLRLWWRGRREPGYRARIGERFGRYDSPAPRSSPPSETT